MGKTSRVGSLSSRKRDPASVGNSARRVRQSPRCRSARKWFRDSLWGLGIGASILAAYALSSALVRSPLFVVERVDVEASERPSPDEIRWMSGIRPGTNLLTLNTADVSRRLEAHPWIRNATVVKRMPDRVLIKIQKRRPAAVVGAQGGLSYMDGEGRILDKIRPGEPLDFPMITGLEQGVREVARGGDGRDVQQALCLLRALQATPALGSVSEIHVDRSKGLSFVLEDFPFPVYAGWSGFSAKMIRFEKIFPLLASQSNSIERVDLRFSGQIVVRHGTGGTPGIPGGDRTEARAGSGSSFHPT